MKPSWGDAPEWARYLAKDKDGKWYWYRVEPDCDGFHCWKTEFMEDYEDAKCSGGHPNWKKSLEERPE